MKNNIIFLCLICFTAINISNAQTSFVLRAGANLQNINGTDASGNKMSNKVMLRYNVAGLVNIPVAPDFFVQTGLVFETKGAKIDYSTPGVPYSNNVQLNYLQIPFNFTYSPVVGKGRILLGFGPYAAYGLGGKVITNESKPGQKVVWNNNTGGSDTKYIYFRPMEFGANFLFGYEFGGHLQVQFNAQLGLTKINATDSRIASDKTSQKNTGFGISLGWKF